MPENQRDASRLLVSKINKYFEAYTSDSYLAPYTSLVPRGGVDKSYAIEHMARKGIYVIYASFADRGSSTYPRRSRLAGETSDFMTVMHSQSILGVMWLLVCSTHPFAERKTSLPLTCLIFKSNPTFLFTRGGSMNV